MSEKNSKNSNGGLVPLIATVVVGIAAIAAVVFLIVMNSGDKGSTESSAGLPSDTSIIFHPTQELVEECNDNAHDLVAHNYEILKLFMLEGMPHRDEPYGNEPEDGYYTAISAKYAVYADLEAFVQSVFTADEAERILHNFDGNGLAVYKAREEHNGALGIIASFTPDTSYNKPWESTRIQFVPVSETECSLTVFLGADENTDLSSVPQEDTLEVSMVKNADGWRLTKLVF